MPKKNKDERGKNNKGKKERGKEKHKKPDKIKDKSQRKESNTEEVQASDFNQLPTVAVTESPDDAVVSQREAAAPIKTDAETRPRDAAATTTAERAPGEAAAAEPQHYHVFLSHNSRDKGSVEPLAVMLREKGLNPFLDKWNLVPGEPIEDALVEALENSDSAVIFVGPGGEGPWQSEEMRDILKRAVKSQNEFRAIPVLLPNASAEALEKSFLGSRLWIEFKDVGKNQRGQASWMPLWCFARSLFRGETYIARLAPAAPPQRRGRSDRSGDV